MLKTHRHFMYSHCVLCSRIFGRLCNRHGSTHKKSQHEADSTFIPRIVKPWARLLSVIERQGDAFDIDAFRNSPNELHLTIKMAEALFLIPGAEKPRRLDNPPKKRKKSELKSTTKESQLALDKMGGGSGGLGQGETEGWS